MDTVVTDTVLSQVEKVVQEFCEEKRSFSAFDVTKKVREKADRVLAHHDKLKEMVHNTFLKSKFPSTYRRILMAVNLPEGRKRIWVYYQTDSNPFDYDPEDVEKKVVKDDIGDEENVCTFTKENRINIPKKLIKRIGVRNGDMLWISQSDNEEIILSFAPDITGPNPGDQGSISVNKDGRVRLTKNLFVYGYNYTHDLEKGVKFVIEDNKIVITPIDWEGRSRALLP